MIQVKTEQRGLRILHVAETLPGGIATYFDQVLPWQVALCGANSVGLVAPESHFVDLAPRTRNGLVEYGYRRKGRDPVSILTLYRAFRDAVQRHQPDIVHAHSSFAGFIVRLAAVPASVVYTPHGWAFARELAAPARACYIWIERRLQSRAGAIIAISAHERDVALTHGLAAQNIHVIRHGLGDAVGGPKRPTADGPLHLLFIGRHDHQKGLDWLLPVVGTLPPERVRLTVAGGAVVSAQRTLPHYPNVSYVGWLDRNGLDEQLGATDALVVPSRWEAFGLVTLEAMRRGVAVLASNRGALAEIVAHGRTGLIFDLADPEGLKRTILGLTRGQLEQWGQAGRARFLEQFAAERMNEETLRLYQAVGAHHFRARRRVDSTAERGTS